MAMLSGSWVAVFAYLQPLMVIMKDLLAVLKADARLSHKPLVYQLQNRVQ